MIRANAMPARLHTARQRRTWLLWLMLCVAVFAALAPAVSHAVAHARGAKGISLDICTTQESKLLQVDTRSFAAASSDGQESAPTLQHCPFCLHLTDRLAPPPSLLPYLLKADGGQQETPIWQAFFFKRIYARWLEPRGPPQA